MDYFLLLFAYFLFSFGFVVSYVAVFTFINPVLTTLWPSWDVLLHFWALSLSCLAMAYAIMFFKKDTPMFKQKPLYVLAVFNLIYSCLSVFVGFFVVLVNGYSVAFAQHFPVAYMACWFLSAVSSVFIVTNTNKIKSFLKKIFNKETWLFFASRFFK